MRSFFGTSKGRGTSRRREPAASARLRVVAAGSSRARPVQDLQSGAYFGDDVLLSRQRAAQHTHAPCALVVFSLARAILKRRVQRGRRIMERSAGGR